MPIAFEKWEGLGNDFLVVARGTGLGKEAAIALCDRHRGVGGDGVLEVGRDGDRVSMRVVNADGSEPEMCGNGLRCVARYVAAHGLASGTRFAIDTAAGPHGCELLDDGRVRIEMRAPSLVPAEIPVKAGAPMKDAAVEVAGRTLHVTAVSMGNPHAVVFDDVSPSERAVLGPALEGLVSLFPSRVNAGFARLTGPRTMELHVYERGAGWTQACGTGACAAAVAAVETGRVPRDGAIVVRLPGGELEIEVGAPGARVRMTGPARRVFSGEAP